MSAQVWSFRLIVHGSRVVFGVSGVDCVVVVRAYTLDSDLPLCRLEAFLRRRRACLPVAGADIISAGVCERGCCEVEASAPSCVGLDASMRLVVCRR